MLLLLLVILLLFGCGGYWHYGPGTGRNGVVGLVVVVILIILLYEYVPFHLGRL